MLHQQFRFKNCFEVLNFLIHQQSSFLNKIDPLIDIYRTKLNNNYFTHQALLKLKTLQNLKHCKFHFIFAYASKIHCDHDQFKKV
jgi:hypothetical protein